VKWILDDRKNRAHFVQRQFVGEHDARRERYSKFFCVPRFPGKLQDSPIGILVGIIMALMIGSSIFSMSLGFGNFAGLSTSTTSPVTRVMR